MARHLWGFLPLLLLQSALSAVTTKLPASSSSSSSLSSWCVPIVVEVPQQHCTTPTTLLDVSLPLSETQFRQLWQDSSFYERYLKYLGDVNIQVGPWASQVHGVLKSMQRTVRYGHPVKYRVPGLGMPKFAGTSKDQFLMEERSGKQTTLIIREINVISDVPFSDRFEIMTTWVARWDAPGQPMRLTVVQEMLIKKAFMLEKTVEKNSITETKETLAVWLKMTQDLHPSAATPTTLQPTSPPSSRLRVQRWLKALVSHSTILKVLAFTLAALLFTPFISPKATSLLFSRA